MVVQKGKILIKLKPTKLLFSLCQPQLHSKVVEIFLYHVFIQNNLRSLLSCQKERQTNAEWEVPSSAPCWWALQKCLCITKYSSKSALLLNGAIPANDPKEYRLTFPQAKNFLHPSKDDSFRAPLVKLSSLHRAHRSPLFTVHGS